MDSAGISTLYEFMYPPHDFLELSEGFPETKIRYLCFQMFQGLAYMHRSHNFIHRDLKPDNILVNPNNLRLKITTTDHVRRLRQLDQLQPYCITGTYNVITTTLGYRAPEVLLDASYSNFAIDMWAAGAIMAELFAGRALFNGSSEAEVLFKICRVLGTPTESVLCPGFKLSDHDQENSTSICAEFPDLPGVRFSELLPNASSDAVNLIASLLSWCWFDRPNVVQALEHPFFHGYYRVPPTVRLEDTNCNIMNSVPFVFRFARKRESLKESTTGRSSSSSSSSSCGSTETKEEVLNDMLLNPFDFTK